MSVVRGRPSPERTTDAIQEFLYGVDLADFGEMATFQKVLNRRTVALMAGRAYPLPARVGTLCRTLGA